MPFYYTAILHKDTSELLALAKFEQSSFIQYWNNALGLLSAYSQPSGESTPSVELKTERGSATPFAIAKNQDGSFRVIRRDWRDGEIQLSILRSETSAEEAEAIVAKEICQRLLKKGIETYIETPHPEGGDRYFKYDVHAGRVEIDRLPCHFLPAVPKSEERVHLQEDALKTYLTRYREKHGWSQTDMALAAGTQVSRAAWSAFELGKHKSYRMSVSLMNKVITTPSERFRFLSAYLQTNKNIPSSLPEDILREIADLLERRAEILALEEAGCHIIWVAPI